MIIGAMSEAEGVAGGVADKAPLPTSSFFSCKQKNMFGFYCFGIDDFTNNAC